MGLALNVDLYELTMAQSFLEHGKTKNAVFSLFVRKLPKNRNFLVSCGLHTLIERLERFRFSEEDLKYLKSLERFSDDFLDYLRNYRFEWDVYAIEEGRIVFENEPLVQIEGPLPAVQILETLTINTIHFQTLIASKSARVYISADGKKLVDFGLRRSHGLEAGLLSARASYITGFDGTSNLEAGRLFGIPVFGTMAHSYIMVFDEEEEAFRAFARSFPETTILLIDTYDTLKAVDKVIKLAKEGVKVIGVRIDSGDLGELAREVRRRFDEEGLKDIKILVSGSLDEYKIEELRTYPIDSFGVGTKFITSSDSPYLDMAYKLVEYDHKPKYKTSPGKKTFPYKRRVLRFYSGGVMDHDEVVPYEKTGKGSGEDLVVKVMEGGSLRVETGNLKRARERFFEDLERLPPPLKSVRDKSSYRVEVF